MKFPIDRLVPVTSIDVGGGVQETARYPDATHTQAGADRAAADYPAVDAAGGQYQEAQAERSEHTVNAVGELAVGDAKPASVASGRATAVLDRGSDTTHLVDGLLAIKAHEGGDTAKGQDGANGVSAGAAQGQSPDTPGQAGGGAGKPPGDKPPTGGPSRDGEKDEPEGNGPGGDRPDESGDAAIPPGTAQSADHLTVGDAPESNETIAGMISSGADARQALDRVATEDPQRAPELVRSIYGRMGGRLERLDTDTLLWMKSHLPVAEYDLHYYLEELVRTKSHDVYAAKRLLVASQWAGAEDKTIAGIHRIADTTIDFEGRAAEHVGEVPIRDIIERNIRPAADRPRPATLDRYTLHPLSAEDIADLEADTDESLIMTYLTNERTAAPTGLPWYMVKGETPLALALHYRGQPQGIIGFDVNGPTVTVQQIQGVREIYDHSTGYYDVRNINSGSMAIMDFPSVALEMLAATCEAVGYPHTDPGQTAVLRLYGADREAKWIVDPEHLAPGTTAITRQQLERIYDDTARRKDMTRDPDGVWSMPLSRLLH